jgi:eukaryotic-like serine/threonine-protein kinase
VAAALIAGTAVSIWQAVRATRAKQLAGDRLHAEQNAHRDADEARRTALADFGQAREAVDRMLTRVADERVINVPGLEQVREALLEDAIQLYERLLAERNTDPELRLATAGAYLKHRWVEGRLGDPVQRGPGQQRRALELLEGLTNEFPADLRYRTALGSCLRQTANGSWDPRRWMEAERTLRRAVDLQESVVLAKPDSVDDAFELASTLHQLGITLQTGNRLDDAMAIWHRALNLSERVAGPESTDPRNLRVQLRLLTNIGAALRRKDPRGAEEFLLRAKDRGVRYRAAKPAGQIAEVVKRTREACAINSVVREIGSKFLLDGHGAAKCRFCVLLPPLTQAKKTEFQIDRRDILRHHVEQRGLDSRREHPRRA